MIQQNERDRAAMRPAVLYAPPLEVRSPREDAIWMAASRALAELVDLDSRLIGEKEGFVARPSPGLFDAREFAPVIALGHAAHLALSNVCKSTLLVDGLACAEGQDESFAMEIETFVWSCVNTMKIVALGEAAWQAAQLLPVAARSFHPVPPLQIKPVDKNRNGVLVIDQRGTTASELALVDALTSQDFDVRCASAVCCGADTAEGWHDGAAIHIHVGPPLPDSDGLRLVESWHGGRLVLQLGMPRKQRAPKTSSPTLEDGENGFVCDSPEDAVVVCRELVEDAALRRKLIAGGERSVAPFLRGWRAIAEDLLA